MELEAFLLVIDFTFVYSESLPKVQCLQYDLLLNLELLQ